MHLCMSCLFYKRQDKSVQESTTYKLKFDCFCVNRDFNIFHTSFVGMRVLNINFLNLSFQALSKFYQLRVLSVVQPRQLNFMKFN